MLWIQIKGPYSQHFIFFVTNELAYQDKVLHFKHSSLLGPPKSYEVNEVLWIHIQGPYSQHFIFFVTNELAC